MKKSKIGVQQFMRGALFGLGILSFSQILLILWRYELFSIPFVYPIILICSAVIILVVSELLWHDVTAFFELVTTSHRYALGFIILIAMLANLTFIGPGYIHADGITHAFKVWYLRKAWLNGSFYPLWCPYWYSGYPFLEFYGPLFYVFAALLSLGSDWMFGSKLALYLACIMSPLAMYGLIYVITQDRLGGIVGGVAYTLTYYKFPLLTKYGHLASSLVLIFLPLLFLSFELAIRKEKQVYAILAGFCWAGVFLSHQGAGYMVSLLVFFYFLFSCAIKFKFENIYLIGRICLISTVVALGLSSFFIIPYFVDGIGANTRIFDSHWLGYPISLPLILTRDFVNVYQPFPVYIGDSILGIAFAAIFLRRTRSTIVYTALLLFSFFLVIGSELPFYTAIPFIVSLEYPYRFLILVSFVASVLSGIAISSIKNIQKPFSGYLMKLKSNPRIQKRIIVILMVIIIIDLWPGTLVSKNRPLDWLVDDEWLGAYNWLDTQTGYHKIMRFGDSGPSYVVSSSIIGNTFDTAGYFRQSTNKDYGEFTSMFKGEIRSLNNAPKKGLLTPLQLLGVKYVLLDTSKNYATHLTKSSELEVVHTSGKVTILEYSGYTSPIIISQSAALVGGENEIDTFYDYVTNPDYDPSKMIFLKEDQYYNDIETPLQSFEDSIEYDDSFMSQIIDLEVREDTILTNIFVSASSFVFFSFNFFPGWHALVDGKESKILIAEPFFMCIYLNEGGTHNISLKYQLNTPKTVGLLITLSTLFVALFVTFWSYKQKIKEIIEQSLLSKYRGWRTK